MVARRRVVVAAGASLVGGCGLPTSMTLSWREDVAFHDGSIRELDVTYELYGIQHSASGVLFRLKRMTLGIGTIPERLERSFEGHRLQLIDRHEGRYLLVFQTRGGPVTRQQAGETLEELGPPLDGSGNKAWAWDSGKFVRLTGDQLPAIPLRLNVLDDHAPFEELVRLNGTHVRMAQKLSLSGRHPPNPGDLQIGGRRVLDMRGNA